MTTYPLSLTLSAAGNSSGRFVPRGWPARTVSAYDSPARPDRSHRRFPLPDWRFLMPYARRLTGSRLILLADTLTQREHQVLASLATMHAATTDQVARSVFPTDPSSLRLARRHLQRLSGFGLVRRFPDRSRDRQVGALGHVHALTAAGLRLAGGQHAVGLRQRVAWRPSHRFLAHRLAISELYARLVQHQAEGGPVVREFLAEPDCWRHYAGPAGQQFVLRPDHRDPPGHHRGQVPVLSTVRTLRPAPASARRLPQRGLHRAGRRPRRHDPPGHCPATAQSPAAVRRRP